VTHQRRVESNIARSPNPSVACVGPELPT
jgi:hypothetical protein